jgi:hypothetical protein
MSVKFPKGGKMHRENDYRLPYDERPFHIKEYEQGEEARSLGNGIEWNPYRYGTREFGFWEQGWKDENKRGY